MKTETTTVRFARRIAGPQPHVGKSPRAEITAFVALLLLSLLTGAAWASAQAAEEGKDATQEVRRTERPAGKDGPPAQTGDLPTVRSHPRGLPRRGHRPRTRRRGRVQGAPNPSHDVDVWTGQVPRVLPGKELT